MHSTARGDAAKCYSPEAALSFKGLGTPGPGDYNALSSTTTGHGPKNKYSVPKVS